MSVTVNPATARTDEAAAAATVRLVRRAGLGVAAGSGLWAAAMLIYGVNPTGTVAGHVTNLTGLVFQLGLFGLVTAQLRTRATGVSRAARALLKVEFVLLGLATLWTVLWSAAPGLREETPMLILDAFWPLSMLGMFIISIKIATAGRWTGLLRGWPLVAESWAVVNVPMAIAFDDAALRFTASGHLLIGYVALGVLMVVRPELTGARN